MTEIIAVIVSLLAGTICLIGFYFVVRVPKPDRMKPDRVLSTILGISTIAFMWISGANVRREGHLLSPSALPDKNLYLVGTTTNVVCLIPARLNGLTAVVEPNGSPSYFEGVEMETNSGVVVAITTKSGEKVLRSFPLKMEVEE